MNARRTTALVLVGGALLVLVMVAVVAVGLERGLPLARKAIITVTLGDDLPEEAPVSVVGRLLHEERRTFGDLVDLFRRAADDERVAAIVARVEPSDLGWARLQELRDAMASFVDRGKTLACHAEVLDTRAYYLASACGSLDMPPAGSFSVPGIAAEVDFYKGTLSKIGVEADMEHVGTYKSASEPLTRQDLSGPAREQLEAMLDAVYATFVEDVAADRGLEPAALRGLLDRGLLSPAAARDAGLIDDLLYYDETLEDAHDGAGQGIPEIEEAEYLRQVRARRRAGRERIAVVYATGTIVSGRSGESGLMGRLLGSETLAEILEDVRDDAAVKAVVLRVDSPGGSGSASDAIWREIRKVADAKPVVASMGDVAASGGYWIAAGADAIVAESLTVTGSIGVVGGKIVLRPFYDWIGVTRETLRRGRNADLDSEYGRFTDEQRQLVRESMQALYREFVARVAEGREKSEHDIDRIGQGRVWTGGQAAENDLVDDLGGLAEAVARARDLAGIPEGRAVGLEIYPRPRGFLEALASLEEGTTRLQSLAGFSRETKLGARLLRERALALMPYRLRLR